MATPPISLAIAELRRAAEAAYGPERADELMRVIERAKVFFTKHDEQDIQDIADEFARRGVTSSFNPHEDWQSADQMNDYWIESRAMANARNAYFDAVRERLKVVGPRNRGFLAPGQTWSIEVDRQGNGTLHYRYTRARTARGGTIAHAALRLLPSVLRVHLGNVSVGPLVRVDVPHLQNDVRVWASDLAVNPSFDIEVLVEMRDRQGWRTVWTDGPDGGRDLPFLGPSSPEWEG